MSSFVIIKHKHNDLSVSYFWEKNTNKLWVGIYKKNENEQTYRTIKKWSYNEPMKAMTAYKEQVEKVEKGEYK